MVGNLLRDRCFAPLAMRLNPRLMAFIFQIQIFDLFPGPWRLAQEFQAGLDAGILREALDIDHAAHLAPAVVLD